MPLFSTITSAFRHLPKVDQVLFDNRISGIPEDLQQHRGRRYALAGGLMGQGKPDPLGYQVLETPLWPPSDFNLLLTLRSFHKTGRTVIRMSGFPYIRRPRFPI